MHLTQCCCSIKSGKVVVMLAGRYAGRKAVVIKSQEDGTDGKKFGHAVGMMVWHTHEILAVIADIVVR